MSLGRGAIPESMSVSIMIGDGCIRCDDIHVDCQQRRREIVNRHPDVLPKRYVSGAPGLAHLQLVGLGSVDCSSGLLSCWPFPLDQLKRVFDRQGGRPYLRLV